MIRSLLGLRQEAQSISDRWLHAARDDVALKKEAVTKGEALQRAAMYRLMAQEYSAAMAQPEPAQ